jgi:hypothetical protein
MPGGFIDHSKKRADGENDIISYTRKVTGDFNRKKMRDAKKRTDLVSTRDQQHTSAGSKQVSFEGKERAGYSQTKKKQQPKWQINGRRTIANDQTTSQPDTMVVMRGKGAVLYDTNKQTDTYLVSALL